MTIPLPSEEDASNPEAWDAAERWARRRDVEDPANGLITSQPSYYPDGTEMPRGLASNMIAWAKVKQDDVNVRVGGTPVGRWWVSTVWIGERERRGPQTFETAIESSLPDGEDGGYGGFEIIARYRTWLQALSGHHVIVSHLQLRCALPPTPRDLS